MSNNLKLQNAYIREYPSGNCDIRFALSIEGLDCPEIIGFAEQTETLGVLKTNIEEKINKLNKNKDDENDLIKFTSDVPDKVDITFLIGENQPCNENMIFRDFNETKENKYMQILGQKYIIIMNAPLVRQLALPYGICANFPVRPIKYACYDCDRTETTFTWFKSLDKKKWDEIGDGFQYDVKESDVGHYLRVCCVPCNVHMVKGPIAEAISEDTVELIAEFPSTFPFENRHALTREKLKDKNFRVVSYNVLADMYALKDRYSYCPSNQLCIHYRKQLIVKELAGYNADIICLQEVDNFHYKNYYQRELKKKNYMSYFHKKGNCMPEGLVCAFNQEKFKKLETQHFVFQKTNEKNVNYKHVFNILNMNTDLKNKIMNQRTSLQITVLQDKKSKNILIVGNTHLYFHPTADDIRLIQGLLAITHLTSLKKKIQLKYNTNKASIMLCGDFNSDRAESLYSFITDGKINPNHPDYLKILPSGGALIEHKLHLTCASGTPKYTNYTEDYKGCLDYIFVETRTLFATQNIPVPLEDDLKEYVGLPNQFYPSDHLALVVDLEFKL